MKLIGLSKGQVAKVSDADFRVMNKHCWYAQDNGGGKFYAARTERTESGPRCVLMHREILNLSGVLDGEHRNGDSLDNQRRNLRPATRSQNHANRIRLPENKTCKYRGVYFHRESKAASWRLLQRLRGRESLRQSRPKKVRELCSVKFSSGNVASGNISKT